MRTFTVRRTDGSTETITDADAYEEQDGELVFTSAGAEVARFVAGEFGDVEQHDDEVATAPFAPTPSPADTSSPTPASAPSPSAVPSTLDPAPAQPGLDPALPVPATPASPADPASTPAGPSPATTEPASPPAQSADPNAPAPGSSGDIGANTPTNGW